MEKNNVEKVYDQIHAPESLKEETLKKMEEMEPKKKFNYSFILSIAALFVFTITLGSLYYANKPNENPIVEEEQIAFELESKDLLHFQSNQEVIEYFEKIYKEQSKSRSYTFGDLAINDMVEDTMATKSAISETAEKQESTENTNYYKTNTQVEDIDEADIVKTDGEYIYYVTNSNVYIVDAKELKLISQLDFSEAKSNNTNYYPSEVFIKENKLIVLGNFIKYADSTPYGETIKSRMVITSIDTTKVYIYDISDKSNPNELRQVDIDGNYDTSRLVGNTLYFISSKYNYYSPNMNEHDILPIYYDSAISNEYRNVDCTNIIYKKESDESTYKTIGAININNNDEIKIETFLGYGDTVYCSQNNLYLTAPVFNKENDDKILNKTEIYKFSILDGGLKYLCKATVDGDVNDQFSLDEYNGNLRIATTVTIEKEPNKEVVEDGFTTVTIGDTVTNNILYVLDENLEKIGELTDFGIEEKIYSARFIGNVAYIVTFKQIDPLFVIDLSDPRNPVMKGELEIPGYSSYLHPYDENHVIGIGYDVKDNGNGRVSNERVKLSMFDVSDLANPKEIFTKSLGEGYSYSEVTYNHKVLMYDKTRNLMGFPINMKNSKGQYEDSILILNIDLENKEFKIHSKYTVNNFNYYIRKVIYIEDTLYILCSSEILSFDINTLNSLGTLKLPYDNADRGQLYYNDAIEIQVEE